MSSGRELKLRPSLRPRGRTSTESGVRLRRARTRRISPFPENSLFILPNLFTALSLFLALFAIVKVAEGEFVFACWLILGSAVCDAIDGPVARLTNTASSFGLQFDSLADLVAFGVAPAFLMYQRLRTMDDTLLPLYAPRLALGACALFAICSAVRLARFNVQAGTVERRFFQGLPTPGAAGTIVAAFLFIEWLQKLPFMADFEYTRLLHRSILILMTAVALLMVSEIPFPKFRNLLKVWKNPFHNLVLAVVVICILITFQHSLPVLLFAAFVIYLAIALAFMRRNRRIMAMPELEGEQTTH
jgi:CDP-diacylglycerol--serine O-phosphatidyltransferase